MVRTRTALFDLMLTTVLLLHAMDRRFRRLLQDQGLGPPEQARRKPRPRHDLLLLRLLQHRHVRPARLLHRRDVRTPLGSPCIAADPSLPFRIRSKGLMVMQLCVNAALVLNQYANPIALDALDWKYYIV